MDQNSKKEVFEGGIENLTPDQVIFCLGMYIKMVSNIEGFNLNIIKNIPTLELDSKIEEEIKNKSINYIYNKAFSFLRLIDLKEKYHIDSIKKYISKEGLHTIKTGKDYFEKLEEYEKCQTLYEFEIFFNSSLAIKS
jgi:hypothetical protein